MSQATMEQILQLALERFQAGRLGEAEQLYRQVLTQEAHQPDALHMLGGLAYQAKRHDLAVRLIHQAIAQRPEWAQAHYNLGNALQALGRLEEATEEYKKAVMLRADYPEAHLNLGNMAVERGHLQEAAACYQRVLALRPDYVEAHNNLGNVLRQLGRLEEALPEFERALELRPGSAEVLSNLGTTFKEQGRTEEALEYYRKALVQSPESPMVHSNLISTMQYVAEHSPEAILQETRRWNEIHARPLQNERTSHDNERSPERRLRMGYVSADFRAHSCAFFSRPLLAHHDHERFEIFCFAENHQEDATTTAIRAAADHWLVTRGLSDAALAQRVREMGIDILVDMMGHTGDHRLMLFARKPAPIQVTYLGYPGTTGLEAMDYRMTDAYADPPGMTEALHTEELIRLPGSFLCYEPPASAPAVSVLPALSTGACTLASFNDVAKISAPTVALWSALLRRLPQARLLLKSRHLNHGPTRARLAALFLQQGVGPERLELHGPTSALEAHLAFYHRADLALDPYPYHGTTTTCEALWMGVPVVTLAGRAHVSRVGVSVLSHVGLEALVAASPEEYVEKALALAQDLPRLSALRGGLRERMRGSTLLDGKGFAQKVESAYRTMWRSWCAKPGEG